MPRTREERFLEKVSQPGCRIWLGARNSWGYGTFSMSPGKNINASRAAWLLFKGDIPEGQDVLHTCDNKLCVNVEHMYLGTDVENGRDRAERGQAPKGEKAWNAKLTEALVLEIRSLYRKLGPRQSNVGELAKRYGVNHATLQAVVQRRSWKHLP